ncbi:MAG: hypothetical protein WC683_06150 [bacterium]
MKSLSDLIAARSLRKELEAHVSAIEAPIKAQLVAASGPLRQLLKQAEEAEEAAAEAAHAEWEGTVQQRQALLLAGVRVPAPELPPGCSVRALRRLVVTDANFIPREYMIPDMKALGKLQDPVPGTQHTIRYSFQVKVKEQP